MLIELAQHVARDVRDLGELGEIELDDLDDFGLDLRIAAHDAGKPREHPRRDASKHRLAKPALVAAVVVKQCLVDTGLLRDLLHPRPSGASANKHNMRGIEDALFGIPVPADIGLTLWFNPVSYTHL